MTHMYEKTEDGIKPCHFVPMAKDPTKTRPTRVSDAKKFAKDGRYLYPSVTTVMGVLDKPGLNNWKVDQHIQTCFESEEIYEITDYDEFLGVVKSITRERLSDAPKAGTDAHQILEDNLFLPRQSHLTEIEHKILDNVEALIIEKTDCQEWDKEKYFIEEVHGYAGCADLSNDKWIIDYKTKQEASKFKPGKMAYPEMCRQLAAYSAGINEGYDNCANIFICLESGEVDWHQWDQQKLTNGWLDFLDCLNIYKRNNYDVLALKGE